MRSDPSLTVHDMARAGCATGRASGALHARHRLAPGLRPLSIAGRNGAIPAPLSAGSASRFFFCAAFPRAPQGNQKIIRPRTNAYFLSKSVSLGCAMGRGEFDMSNAVSKGMSKDKHLIGKAY